MALEDLAVAAYKGQAGNIRSPGYLAAAISIHSVEARHAAWMRYLLGRRPAANAFDKPISAAEAERARRLDALHRLEGKDERRQVTAIHRLGPRALLALVGVVVAAGSIAWQLTPRSPGPWRFAAADTLPPPAVSQLHVPSPAALNSASATTWAPVRRRVVARAAPSPVAHAVAVVERQTPEGTTNLAVVTGARALAGRLWVRLLLPTLPNGTQGWVPRSALGGYTVVNTRAGRQPAAISGDALSGRPPIMRVPFGVGTTLAPTPRGTFYIRDKLTRYASPFYGPVAFGTSARSEALTDWPAGGFIGIHGTDRPALIPGRISHGCIRIRNADLLRLSSRLMIGSLVIVRD